MRLYIPTINDEPEDFRILFNIWNLVKGKNADVQFDFSRCNFLRPNAVAFLGGLARLIESRLGKVIFDWDSFKSDDVKVNLCQNGFAGAFGYSSPGWDGNAIPYREDLTLDMNEIMDYLTDNWMGKGWVRVSDMLRDRIVGRMWEIYNNAFEHSNTPIGVFSCGQHLPRSNKLVLSVVDFGRGITTNVREFLRMHIDEGRVLKMNDASCLIWAFGVSHSTCSDGVSRGLGLDLLKDFVRINQGKLEIYSNKGYAIVDKKGERYENREISFEGTAVHITLRCDESLYRLKGEPN